MQVFKTFFKILLRNIVMILVYLVIFVGLSISIAKNSESNDRTNFQETRLNIAIIDNDHSTLSDALSTYLKSCHNISSLENDKDKWTDAIFYRTVDYILVIEQHFEQHLSEKNYDHLLTSYSAPDSNTSYIVQSQAETFIQHLSLYLDAGYTPAQSAFHANETAQIKADVQIADSENQKMQVSPISYFFRFMPYILICVMINSLGATLIAWNKPEIKARTSVSATSLISKNAGMIAAMAVYALVITGIFILVCICSYRKDFFSKSTIYYGMNAFCYMLVCVAVTFLIAQLSKKVSVLSMWSNVIGLSTSFLCGVFVQRDLLSDQIVACSKWLPTYWYINVTEELTYFRGSLSRNAWISMGMQLLFAAAIFSAALVIIKNQQQKNTC